MNIFSTFESVSAFNLAPNWIVTSLILSTIPTTFWLVFNQMSKSFLMTFTTLNKEFQMNFSMNPTPGHTHWAIAVFLFIMVSNSWGLFPYVYTSSSHLPYALTLGLTSWVAYSIYSLSMDPTHYLGHLLPTGTPVLLYPAMVIIETISTLIRPFTLSVRLVANITAGHILISLCTSVSKGLDMILMTCVIFPLLMLMLLETAVAFIQAYVFSMLSTLYLAESNFTSLQ